MTFSGGDVAIIIVGLMSFGGVCVTAWVSWLTRRDTREINDAVNHRHPDGMRLYDLAIENQSEVRNLNDRVDGVECKLDTHIQRCRGEIEPA